MSVGASAVFPSSHKSFHHLGSSEAVHRREKYLDKLPPKLTKLTFLGTFPALSFAVYA